MSRKKHRNEHAGPALFTFLDVFLCTIGALILILVIAVATTQASAHREALSEVHAETAVQEFFVEDVEAQREILKTKIERRRRELANIEDHISRLSENLKQLVDRIERIQSETTVTEVSKQDKIAKVASLREEIDEKKRELLDAIEKQKKRKPAFSVIPYTGNNGTSRRPVYLECTNEGVVVQPEGLLISLNDLKPPFGPGNPLDAALRVLRIAYQQKDVTFGITQPPYPLLLVRPDGIQTYALAREAMSGWDDQFGYELIDKDMDLKFPSSVPGLKEQLVGTIDLAKRRQRALIAAMPRRPVAPEEQEDWDTIDAANSKTSGSQSTREGSGSNANAIGFDPGSPTGSGVAGTGAAGTAMGNKGGEQEWKMVQGLANSQVTGTILRNGSQASSGANSNAANLPDQTNPNLPNTTLGGANLQGEFIATAGQTGSMPNQTSAQPLSSRPDAASGNFTPSGASPNDTAANQASGQPGAGDSNPSETPGGGSNLASGGATGTAQSGSTNSSNQPSASSGSPPSDPKMNMFSSGTANGMASSMPPPPSTEQNKADPNAPQSVSLSINKDLSNESKPPPKAKHVNPDGDLKPISVSAGRGWAASRAEGKATPVSRPINVVALKDRWLLRSDVDPTQFDETITMDEGPQQAGNELAKALRKRVDSWGLSVPGGFWSPTLTIESARDAQQSVARLEKLLEGSGVEIKVVPLKLPNRR
jgi:hypothetical protein